MECSLLSLHVRFNKPEMEAVMGAGAVYVTMLRDPVEVFESQFAFYDFHGFYGMNIGNIYLLHAIAVLIDFIYENEIFHVTKLSNIPVTSQVGWLS